MAIRRLGRQQRVTRPITDSNPKARRAHMCNNALLVGEESAFDLHDEKYPAFLRVSLNGALSIKLVFVENRKISRVVKIFSEYFLVEMIGSRG